MLRIFNFLTLSLWLALMACSSDKPEPQVADLQLLSAKVGTLSLQTSGNTGVPVEQPLVLRFSEAVDISRIKELVQLRSNNTQVDYSVATLDGQASLSLQPVSALNYHTTYSLLISSELKSTQGGSFAGAEFEFTTVAASMQVLRIELGDLTYSPASVLKNVPTDTEFRIVFSHALNASSVSTQTAKILSSLGETLQAEVSVSDNTITVHASQAMSGLLKHSLLISSLVSGAEGEIFAGLNLSFFTAEPSEPVFPLLTDEELIDLVEHQTFEYFWSGAHAASGMARERNTSGNTVTTGGSGFGLMALVAGMHRGYITREQGIVRLQTVVNFLEHADRFHGAWSHWIDGNTGHVIPFSTKDNGGDLVETAFMAQGLLTVRQYLDANTPTEAKLISDIDALLDAIEWDWYTRDGQNVLYWHWSPSYNWDMNMTISGYNEALIVYVMAATSKNHRIAPEVYHNGWARNGSIRNDKSFYGITLPVGYDYGGPLFFAHYSFLGLDPRQLQDQYANYWQQNTAHTLINRAYCVLNPKNYPAYGADCWGLTASDQSGGYGVHEPTRDNGTISPTAALSSMPYAPDEVLETMRFFYYKLGDKLWGEHGFHDAFNIELGWYASSYLAIDQGPVVIGIENYRSGLLWDLFMSAPEVSDGLDHLGFTSY